MNPVPLFPPHLWWWNSIKHKTNNWVKPQQNVIETTNNKLPKCWLIPVDGKTRYVGVTTKQVSAKYRLTSHSLMCVCVCVWENSRGHTREPKSELKIQLEIELERELERELKRELKKELKWYLKRELKRWLQRESSREGTWERKSSREADRRSLLQNKKTTTKPCGG